MQRSAPELLVFDLERALLVTWTGCFLWQLGKGAASQWLRLGEEQSGHRGPVDQRDFLLVVAFGFILFF